MERFVHEAESSGASQIRVAGTNAFRVARNGRDVADRYPQRIGDPVDILTGEEEARLEFLTVISGLSAPHGRPEVVDIGGGRTELICGAEEKGTQLISL